MDDSNQRRAGTDRVNMWSTVIFLIGVSVASFALRSYRMYPEFISSDMAGATGYILDGIPDDISARMLLQREMGAAGNPLRNFLYHYSPLAAVMGFLNVVLMSGIGIRINEYIWVLPMIVIGAVTPIAIYALVEKVADRRSAIVAALVIALFPMHVIQSRVLGPAYALGFLTQVLVIYTLLNYLRSGQRKDAFCFSVCFATSIYSDFLWPGVVPVILYTTYVNSGEEGGFRKRAIAALSKLFRPDAYMAPLAALLALIAASVAFRHGPLVHLFRNYGYASRGLYIDYFYRTMLENSGYVMGAVMTLFFFVGVRELAAGSQASILFVWGCIYTVPFWFHKFGLSVVTYSNYGLQAFAIFSSILLVRCLSRRGALTRSGHAIIAFVLLSLLYATVYKTYGYNSFNVLGLTGWQGSYAEPTGMKAAGVWLRGHTQEHDRIFAFAYGGTGMEPSNAFYYFNRTIIGKFDSPSFDDMFLFLQRFKDETDYLVIAEADYQRIRNFVDANFYPTATVRSEAGAQLLWIFSRERVGEVDVLEMQESSAKFDEEFGHLRHLPSELKFRKAHPNPYARYYWEGFSPMNPTLH